MHFVEQHICPPLHSESNPCFLTWMQVIPCAVLALFIHPSTSHHFLNRIFWAFCVYLEAVSVLPQLRVMQNTKVPLSLSLFFFFYRSRIFMSLFFCFFLIWIDIQLSYIIFLFLDFQIVEPFTAHYVFALGVARFLSCAHWVLQVWSCKFGFICFELGLLFVCVTLEMEFAAYAASTFGLMWFWDSHRIVICLFGRGILIIEEQKNEEHHFR